MAWVSVYQESTPLILESSLSDFPYNSQSEFWKCPIEQHNIRCSLMAMDRAQTKKDKTAFI